MTRSQEALEKRAEKRSVPVEEQRLKDSRKKTRKEGDAASVLHKKKAVLKKKSSDVKIQSILDTNDWICIKCTNKNFHHRETCNRCQSSRLSQASLATAVAAHATLMKTTETVKSPPATAVTANINWICLSCKNDNFPTRTECNRCQSERPKASSTSCSKLNSSPTKVKIQTKAPPADRIPKGMGLISGKSLSWGKQATDIELAENKRLREAISEGDETALTAEELARATILKERSLRKKDKKEKQLKWKQKKLSIKSGVAIAAIAAIKKATQK